MTIVYIKFEKKYNIYVIVCVQNLYNLSLEKELYLHYLRLNDLTLSLICRLHKPTKNTQLVVRYAVIKSMFIWFIWINLIYLYI